MDCMLPPDTHLGQRAARLREDLGLSTATAAACAGTAGPEVVEFESSGDCSIGVMVALHRVLSNEPDLSHLFTMPKFDNLDEVEEYGRRRIARR